MMYFKVRYVDRRGPGMLTVPEFSRNDEGKHEIPQLG
jgi:hypothetical protein